MIGSSHSTVAYLDSRILLEELSRTARRNGDGSEEKTPFSGFSQHFPARVPE